MPNPSQANSITLKQELFWFDKILETRISIYFNHEGHISSIYDRPPPDISEHDSVYAEVVQRFNLGFNERIIIILALMPHVRPQGLDIFFTNNKDFGRSFTEFGGWTGKTHGGFLPTGETAAFVLAGVDLEKRFEVIKLFEDDHLFKKENILRLVNQGVHEPFLSGLLALSTEYRNKFTTGEHTKPDYSINFPAKLINTKLEWSDLVLSHEVMDEIQNIKAWIKHSKTIMNNWEMGKVIKPGYRCLFYGPPGTGKTLTATLIGEAVGADVYRIDLSMVISKYIGETEKNLANVFDQAENRNWILFFDEADALFGKRTMASNSNDRHANQEISYLLQRIEDFDGVVILATNLKANIDEAFARRFQGVMYFPMPDPEQRYKIWKNVFNTKEKRVNSDVNLNEIAEKYEISGGAIINILRYGALKALQNNKKLISKEHLLKGISKELIKEGKTL
jgi:hypothetical protein